MNNKLLCTNIKGGMELLGGDDPHNRYRARRLEEAYVYLRYVDGMIVPAKQGTCPQDIQVLLRTIDDYRDILWRWARMLINAEITCKDGLFIFPHLRNVPSFMSITSDSDVKGCAEYRSRTSQNWSDLTKTRPLAAILDRYPMAGDERYVYLFDKHDNQLLIFRSDNME